MGMGGRGKKTKEGKGGFKKQKKTNTWTLQSKNRRIGAKQQKTIT